MNDELLLSLYLDGRLPDAQSFEARLASEPALRARLDAMRRLQALSAGLAPVSAAFSADDVRLRAGLGARGGWRRLGLAAAAVLALAATHAGVYAAGARRGAEVERAGRESVERAAALLERAAEIDIAAPPEELETQLATLHRQIPPQLVSLSHAREPVAMQYADALRQMDLVLEKRWDAAFKGLKVGLIANSSLDGAQLRLVPATATGYRRVLPAEGGRYVLIAVEDVNGTPRTIVDEGTPEELEQRRGIRLRRPQERR